ncbi:hypothetical protein ElyMa_007045100 [Elysia marginata]|uniref:Uncharacterized protein n=1 Tax=Elysia marginata TaxID=1093978 RepID=A0AAV4JTN7_9GAST|nr:hypothetical protein ElyMa_007045100 [Elysia marginata]
MNKTRGVRLTTKNRGHPKSGPSGRETTLSRLKYLECRPWNKNQSDEMLPKKADISEKDNISKEEIKQRMNKAIGPYADLFTLVTTLKTQWYGHFTHSPGLVKIIIQCSVQGNGSERRPGKSWKDSIT